MEKYINPELLERFEFRNYGHALEILSEAFPAQWSEIQECLSSLSISKDDNSDYITFVTRKGLVKRTKIEEFDSIRKELPDWVNELDKKSGVLGDEGYIYTIDEVRI